MSDREQARQCAEDIAMKVDEVSEIAKGPRFLFREFIDELIAVVERHYPAARPCQECERRKKETSTCCGDAHEELRSALEHLNLIGFTERRVTKDGICEILWANTRAEAAEEETARLREEIIKERDTLTDHYFQDEGVTPDGELRPLISKLLKRVEAAEQENAKLREQLANADSETTTAVANWEIWRTRCEQLEAELRTVLRAYRYDARNQDCLYRSICANAEKLLAAPAGPVEEK